MEEDIIKFITRYIPLTEEEIQIVKEQKLIKAFPKGTILLAEGMLAKECYFIIKGCIRSYYIINGEERSTEFYTENQSITPISYVNKVPSEYFLSCLEDCIVALGSTERNKILVERIPHLATLISQMNSDLLVQSQIKLDHYKNLSPESRYLDLLHTRPDLLQRVPLHHIATFLGITPVSLSRLRRRIASK